MTGEKAQKSEPKGRIFISRPCAAHYTFNNVVTVNNMKVASARAGWVILEHYNKSSNIVKHRNEAVLRAQAEKMDYILYVDSDSVVRQDFLLRLLARDTDIISGCYHAKQPPHGAIFYRYDEDGVGQSVESYPEDCKYEVDYAGCGFMLIKMKVFDKIELPYFLMAEMGEDEYFCLKAKQAGFRVYVDTAVQVGHDGDYVYTVDDYLACKFAREREEKKKASRIPLIVDPQGKALVS